MAVNQDLVVQQIIEGSPAETVGLKPGDVIKSVGDQEIQTREELIRLLGSKQSGDAVVIGMVRDGEEKQVDVKLAAVPPAAGERGRRAAQETPTVQTEGDESDLPGTEAKESMPEVAVDDPVSGTWEGVMNSPRGESDLTLVLKRKSDKEITGSYQTPRGEGEITEGSFNPQTQMLTLFSDSGQFTLEFAGKIAAESCEGEVVFNAGSFTMDFQVQRSSRETGSGAGDVAADDSEDQAGTRLEDSLPGPRWVSSLDASRFKAERCYASFDGHRSNDDEPYLFVTEDYGKTWKSIRGNLPASAGSVRVLREDRRNENVLYLGCEFGAWVSIDRGNTWTRMKQIPTVAVHEFAQHPTLDDMAIATHGRSLWIADVTLLRQTEPEVRSENVRLFNPRDVYSWRSAARRGNSGTRRFVGQNPETQAQIAYVLGKNARRVQLTIENLKGEVVKRFEQPPTGRGLHTLEWDLRSADARGRGRFGPRVGVGEYLVNLRVDGQLLQTTLSIKPDPEQPRDAAATDEELQWWLEFSGQSEQPGHAEQP